MTVAWRCGHRGLVGDAKHGRTAVIHAKFGNSMHLFESMLNIAALVLCTLTDDTLSASRACENDESATHVRTGAFGPHSFLRHSAR